MTEQLREVNKLTYKIIIMELPELKSLEVFVYNKPKNFLQKIFILAEDFVAFATRTSAAALENEKSLERLFLKYFQP